jgi:SPP1 gp7 family putative phage head morphogenesis protein
VNKIVALLNETEDDLVAAITSKLAAHTGLETPADVARLDRALAAVKALRASAFDNLNQELNDEMLALAQSEPKFLANKLDTTMPVVLDLSLPPAALLRKLVTSKPFQGRTLKQWADTLQEADLARIESQIRLGVGEGEDSATVARRIVGTARLKGTDGMTQITRRNAEAITRTAINAISNDARAATMIANKGIIHSEVFMATLDSRTTPICRAKDGNVYEVGKGPRPPLHFNCRSIRVPTLDGNLLGNRPMKASTEKMLLREYAEQNGLDKVPTSRDGLPFGAKGAFDEFARKRVRELTGTVPATVTYQEWLTTQSNAFQDDILGPTRGALFRDGGLTLDKFVNRTGDEINLHDLAAKQADAFRAAGLDPGDF